MSSILITGCAGLIGSNLAKQFLEQNIEVIGVDSLIGGYRDNIDSRIHFYNIDITNFKELTKVFNTHKPSTVIHCAALAHEGLSVFAPKTIAENIYAGTLSVASAAIASGTKLFINTSSMARYGNATPPFTEATVPTPIDPYGMAKLQAEQQLNLLSDIHGIKVIHTVPHNVCGPNQCYSDPFRNVMSIFINRIMQDKPIYVYGDGNQKRSFSHVDDCINAFVTLYNNVDTIENKSVFNIGPDDGTEITINELAEKIYRHFNVKPNIIHVPERPREVKHAWVSTNKAKELLNYKTTKDVDITIEDTVKWVRISPRRDFNYHLDLEIITDKTPKTWTDKLFNK